MRELAGVEKIALDEGFLEGEIARFQLQFLQTMERLFNRIYVLLTTQSKARLQLESTLLPQIDTRISEEETRVKIRLKQSLDEKRQQSAGITKYIWRSQDDDKVRTSHAINDDKVFEWAVPPLTGHPNHEFGCRCFAEPVLADSNEGTKVAAFPLIIPAVIEGVVIIGNIAIRVEQARRAAVVIRAAGTIAETLPDAENPQRIDDEITIIVTPVEQNPDGENEDEGEEENTEGAEGSEGETPEPPDPDDEDPDEEDDNNKPDKDTDHGEERKIERDVTKEEIDEAIESAKKSGKVTKKIGKYGTEQILYEGDNDITVVVETEGRNAGKIITIWRK